MDRILALSIETTRLGASWRGKDGDVRCCSLPLHEGTLALADTNNRLALPASAPALAATGATA